MTSKQIRQTFLDFFQSKQHQIVASAPIVLKDDPTLMFSNSGMAQFKDYFLGYRTPEHRRIADTQKCLRVSGKHNDLDDVGRDTYHHTMFEMLGNWSFADYFKKEAIDWAWELLTEVYALPKEDLYVTIFEGDASENLERDEDAYQCWKKWVAEDRILNGNKKDNFWEMGESGPCGPCSEIHIDLRTPEEKAQIPGKDLVNADHPQVVEIWNLVFMEFLRKADGTLEKLPEKHVDTGMGFERLCMALQKKTSNYDTDVFTPLIQALEKKLGVSYTAELKNDKDVAIRVVVDHIRAVVFSIADGQLPSNTGAGYVIRRILRRAISFAYRFLGMREAFMYELAETMIQEMGEAFPEIKIQKMLIQNVIKEEEQSFLKTIEKGLERLDGIIKQTIEKGEKNLPGDAVFELYDTFGFPADLSRIIAEEKQLGIDEEGFNEEMQKQKSRSKKSSEQQVSDWVILSDEPQKFIGYDVLKTVTPILRYREIQSAKGTLYQIVLRDNPFYAESGGQKGDRGVLVSGEKQIEVINCKKEGQLQIIETLKLPTQPNQEVKAQVDVTKRQATQANHSATHLLHEALRDVLGTHVEQKGSYVGDDYLRFDFSHFGKMTEEELSAVIQQVQEKINKGIALEEYRDLPIDEALAKGAMALFGEKYGDKVRMICFGSSKELCGGTHVKNTSEIGDFILKSEASSSAGIRRIEAITGNTARAYIQQELSSLENIRKQLKSKDAETALEKLLQENTQLKAELEKLKAFQLQQTAKDLENAFTEKDDMSVLIKKMDISPAEAKDLVFQLKAKKENAVIILITEYDGKPGISIGTSGKASASYPANIIIKELSTHIQGGGGGNEGFASAGGKNLNGTDAAFSAAHTKFAI